MIILYSKFMRLFVGSRFLVSHRGLHKLIHFYGLSPLGTMFGHNLRVFHSMGDLCLLADTRHIFSFSCIKPYDSVRRCPFNRAHPIKHQCNVDSLIMQSHSFNAMSPCICNAICHCLFVPCPIDECDLDNFIKHAYHQCILGNCIKHAYNFPTLTHSCQCITQAYINIIYKSLLSQVMKHFTL